MVVVVFRQQIAIYGCKERVLEDTVCLAIGLDRFHTDTQFPLSVTYSRIRPFAVGYKLTESVAAIKILGIPLLTLLEGWCLHLLCFRTGHVGQCQNLWLYLLTTIGSINVGKYHLQGRTIGNEMVNVNEDVEMLAVFQQSDTEQPIFKDMKRHHHSPLFRFNVYDTFYLQAERLAVIDALHWFALFVQFNACKQRRMCGYNRLYRCLKLFFIQTDIKSI